MSTLDSSATQSGTTGKYLVLLPEEDTNEGINILTQAAGIASVARAADFADGAVKAEQITGKDALVFDHLNVASMSLDPDQFQSLSSASTDRGPMLIEPERIVYAQNKIGINLPEQVMAAPIIATQSSNLSVEYLQGYRDAINNLVDNLLLSQGAQASGAAVAAATEPEFTWGLKATKVLESPFTGRGIKVAVLDTGMDLTHPDFAGRNIISKSFIANEDVQDGQGHGTHCIGTACGPRQPQTLPRYGVAYDAEIYAGKVLSNKGSGADGGILAGIEWAITNDCHIISMSLGAATYPGQPFSRIFENVAKRALRQETLIIAAAGNESGRPKLINPVGHPANCPSIMGVAAIDSRFQVASFSNRGINPDGGQVDIAGPGVDVYSTYPMPDKYRRLNGTSMATPHVAGIAALYAEATGANGRALWSLLVQNAYRLELPSADVGVGLTQAPLA
ncbi:MAG: S8 family serine peptidase [Cyanothece sp. SIO1E1]|nr:S8 family serine peptidase [Cyanothece sp. SIO1E1]